MVTIGDVAVGNREGPEEQRRWGMYRRLGWARYQNGSVSARGLIYGRIQSKRVLGVLHRCFLVPGSFWDGFGCLFDEKQDYIDVRERVGKR